MSRLSKSNFSQSLNGDSSSHEAAGLGAETKVGECTWELPSVSGVYSESQRAYGALKAPCGGNTESATDKPLNTYWRSEYYDSGCSAPVPVTRWQDDSLNSLFETTDPFQRTDRPHCA